MLTVPNLNKALEDDRHLGWGYAQADLLDLTLRATLDESVIEVANDLGLDDEQLFTWANSKHGRWLIDDVHGCSAPATPDTVRRHLSRDIIAALAAEDA